MNTIKRCRYGSMVFPINDRFQGRSLDTYGEYNLDQCRVLEALLEDGNNVIDVGASIGSTAFPMAKAVGSEGSIIAFEPERFSYYMLCSNIAMNNVKNIYCFNQAIGDSKKVVKVPEINSKETTDFGSINLKFDWTQSNHYPILMNVIDLFEFDSLNLIKISVCGMELDVLKGAIETIKNTSPIIHLNFTSNKSELSSCMKNLGYKSFSYEAYLYNKNNFFEMNPESNLYGSGALEMAICLPENKIHFKTKVENAIGRQLLNVE